MCYTIEMKQTREEQLEKKRIEGREYYLKNKERMNERGRENYAKKKALGWKYNKKHSREYQEKNKDRLKEYAKKHQREIRKTLIILMGGKCVKCGFDDERALQIDHIHGGGYKERKEATSKNFNRRAIKSVKNNEGVFQLLCANCNWIKRHENNENRSS